VEEYYDVVLFDKSLAHFVCKLVFSYFGDVVIFDAEDCTIQKQKEDCKDPESDILNEAGECETEAKAGDCETTDHISPTKAVPGKLHMTGVVSETEAGNARSPCFPADHHTSFTMQSKVSTPSSGIM